MTRWSCAATLPLLLFAAQRAQAAEPRSDFHLWGKVSLDVDEWKSSVNVLQIAQGLDLGLDGYLYRPDLGAFSVAGGLVDLNRHMGSWSTDLGWRVGGRVQALPKSHFPLELHALRLVRGIAPGGSPAASRYDSTDIGGSWAVELPRWPSLSVSAAHTTSETAIYQLGSVVDPAADIPPFGETRTNGRVELLQSAEGRSHRLGLELARDASNGGGFVRRRVRLEGDNRAPLGGSWSFLGAANAEVGDLEAQERGIVPYHRYAANLSLMRTVPKGLRVNLRNRFSQDDNGELASALRDQLVGQVDWPLREWLQLLGGAAGTFADERSPELSERWVRGELGTGARVRLPFFGGASTLRAEVQGRAGATHVIEQGSGLLLGLQGNLGATMPVGRFEVELDGGTNMLSDRSPNGVDSARHTGMVGVRTDLVPRVRLDLRGQVTREDQEEVQQGTWSDRATSFGGRLIAESALPLNILMNLSGAFNHYVTSELGAQRSVQGELRLVATPLQQLTLDALSVFDVRWLVSQRVATVRQHLQVAWAFRRVLVKASYDYMVDANLGIEAGEHRAMLHVERRFDANFWRAKE